MPGRSEGLRALSRSAGDVANLLLVVMPWIRASQGGPSAVVGVAKTVSRQGTWRAGGV